jgi:hypothetical protein
MVKQGQQQQSYTRKSYFIYLCDNFNDILLNERGFHILLLPELRDDERKLIPVEMHFMRWIANHNHFGHDRNEEIMLLLCIS